MSTPATNEEGVLTAIQQLRRLQRPGWTLRYDRQADTLYARAPNHGPCVSFWLPGRPEILLRLSRDTNELEGIDFTEYRRVLMKADRMWGQVLRALVVATVMDRLGLIHRAERRERAAAERVRKHTQGLCPTA